MKEEEPTEDWSSHEAAVIRTMTEYDMVESPDEPYYARQYLHWILPEIGARFPDRRVEVLDLGCGQGRLTLPISRWCDPGGGRVTAVDLTASAVEKARAHASEAGLSNVTFHVGDVLTFTRGLGDASVDVAMLIEVTFFLPTYREVVREMARVLRPGGILFAAFRSQYYNLLQTVWSWKLDGAEMALREREGYLWGEPVWYTWQTPDDIRRLLGDVGLGVLSLRGIGACSGLQEDPHGTIIRPSQLPPEDQERLMAIECAAAEPYAACGRYILAIAEKPAP
jgi:ubiquinone/menaquinone biosynthesis C-methylase UbiE